MVFIPAFEKLEHRTYIWYVGEPIHNISLWIRYEDSSDMEIPGAEYPIYQNSRGLGCWNSTEITYGDGDEIEPSDAFWEALAKINDPDWHGEIDIEDCEWYEREAINSLGDHISEPDDYSGEMRELLTHAEREVRDPADIVDNENE